MANYINIGSTCANFDYEPGTIPIASLTSLYLINGITGMPLKDTPVPTSSQTTGFLAVTSYTGGSNNFSTADNEFKVYFSEGLSRFASGRQDWRYLTDSSASAPTYNDAAETGSLQYQTVVTAGGSVWPTQSTINSGASFASGIQVTHPAVGGSTYYLVNSSNVLMYTYANTNIVTLPSPISYTSPTVSTTISMDNTPVFYLYNKTNDIRYLTYSGTAFGISDTNTVNAVQPTAFYMTRVRSGTRIFMALATGTPGSGTTVSPTSDGVVVLSNFEVQITSATAGVAGTYRITTVNPPLGETPVGFPDTTSTLMKHVATGKYLYWTGTGINSSVTSPAIFDLVDFWSSGLSANQIIQGMQFKFQDMTGISNASAAGSGTLLDWYHWKVVTDVTKAPSATNNTANVAVTRFSSNSWVIGSPSGQFFGNQSTSTDVHPSKFEGWSIYGTSGASSNALVYVRVPQAGGLPTPVGYITVSSGGNLSFVQSSILPNLTIGGTQNANAWVCYKCTTASGQYCSPYSSGGSSAPKALGTISVSTIPASQASSFVASIAGSGLATGDSIVFRLSTGPNMSGTIIPLSTSGFSFSGSSYTLNLQSPTVFISGNQYTVELSSGTALVTGSPTTFSFTVPKALGTISAVTVKTTTTFDVTIINSGLTTGDVVNLRFSLGNFFVVGAGQVSVGQGISSPSGGLYIWTSGTTATIPVTLSSPMQSNTGHVFEISAPNVIGITGSPHTITFTSLTLKALDLGIVAGFIGNNQISISFRSTCSLVTGDSVNIRVFRGASVATGTLITGTTPSSTPITKSGAYVTSIVVSLPSGTTFISSTQYTHEVSHTYTHATTGNPVTVVETRTFTFP